MHVCSLQGDIIPSGAVISSGEVLAMVVRTGVNTVIGRSLALLRLTPESGLGGRFRQAHILYEDQWFVHLAFIDPVPLLHRRCAYVQFMICPLPPALLLPGLSCSACST